MAEKILITIIDVYKHIMKVYVYKLKNLCKLYTICQMILNFNLVKIKIYRFIERQKYAQNIWS